MTRLFTFSSAFSTSLCTAFFMLLPLAGILGQADEMAFKNKTTVDYNNCTGIATIEFPVRNNDGSNFAHVLRWIEVRSLLPGEVSPSQGVVKFRMTAEAPIYVSGSNCNSNVGNPKITPLSGADRRTYNVCEGANAEHQENANTYEVVNGTGDERFIKVTIRDLRNSFFGSEIKFQLSGVYDFECCWNGYSSVLFPPSSVSYTFDFAAKWSGGTAATIAAPSLSPILNGPCQSNMLDWNDVVAPNNCPGLVNYYVYRDNLFLGTVSTSQYTDANLSAGQMNQYYVQANWVPQGNTRVANSIKSNDVSKTVPYPNGEIHGKVSTLGGAPVQGVTVKATLTNASALTACPNLSAPSGGYTVSTQSDGTYHIYNVFYGGTNDPDANYKVEGFLSGHTIPPEFNVYLNDSPQGNIKNNINLVDETAVTLSGVVSDGVCPLAGVQVAGFSTDPNSTYPIVPVMTGANGRYYITLPGPGSYNIRTTYRDYVETKNTNVSDLNPPDLNFTYPDKAILSGYVRAGCQEFIGSAQVQALSGNCIIATTNTNGNGYYQMNLPRRPINIVVGPFTPIPGSGLSGPLGDSKSIDHTEASSLDFTFHKPISLQIEGMPAPACAALPYPVLEQRVSYPLTFTVTEGGICTADTGYVVINNFISGNSQQSQFIDTVPIQDGVAYYVLEGGDPNILGNHLKNISFVAHVDTENSGPINKQAIVTGALKSGNNFTTTSPQIPYMIIRDPPGSQSNGYFQKDSAITMTQSFSTKLGGGVNVWAKAKAGVDIFSLKVWGKIGGYLDISGSTTTSDDFVLEMKSTDRFETSDDELVTGPRGDVFIGAAINMIYAKADILEFDLNTCSLQLDTIIMIDQDGFSTRFAFTDRHIRTVVMKNLREVIANAPPTETIAVFEAKRSLKVWEQVLTLNDDLKEKALTEGIIDNFTFGGQVVHEADYSVTSSSTKTIEFETIIDAQIALEAGFEIAGNGASGGVKVNFSTEIGKAESTNVTTTTSSGYHFQDSDAGDQFTVDVVTDPVYGTPVFRLLGGQSRCPYEEGTAKRDVPTLMVTNPVQYAAPGVNELFYNFSIGNGSETNDAGQYELSLTNATNPGALVTLGSSSLATGIPYFNFPKGESIQEIKVSRNSGSSLYSFEGLELCFYPLCDTSQAVCTQISAFFESPCSDISLFSPSNGWLVNNTSNNMMDINIRDYDLGTTINEVRLEYAPKGSTNWTASNIILAKNQLATGPNGTTVSWDVNNIPDGLYDIRLRLNCGSSFNYSLRKSGRIDRTAPLVYGKEQPLDDDYKPGGEISVLFNEDIACNMLTNANLALRMMPQNTLVPAQLLCDGRKITVVPNSDISGMLTQGFEVQITGVNDLYGNASSLIVWTFSVGDPDSDMDGIPDSQDRCPGSDDYIDTDLGGVPDGCDCDPLSAVNEFVPDDDCDLIVNVDDLCPDSRDAALHFDGIDDQVQVPSFTALENLKSSHFSISAWVYPTDSSSQTIVSKGHGYNQNTSFLFQILDYNDAQFPLAERGTLGLYIGNGSTANWFVAPSSAKVPVNEWSHIAVSYYGGNGGTNQALFWINGVFQGSNFAEIPNTFSDPNHPLWIGRQGDACSGCSQFSGKMDELTIWSRVLQQSEVSTIMNLQPDTTNANLVAYYDFNEGQPCNNNMTNTTLNNYSPNNANGTLQNFSLQPGCNSNWTGGSNKITNCNSCVPTLVLNASTGVLDGTYTAGSQITLQAGTQFGVGKNVTLSAPTVLFEMDNAVPTTTILDINQDGCQD